MNPSLSAIERDLRRAAETQRYDEVRRLVLSFCAAVETHVRSLPAGDPRIPEIAQMSGEVLQWTRAMVQSGRESLAAQLRQLPKVKRYLPAPATRPAVLQMDI
ncbi:MAG TPA: hypothetical protein VJ732_18080 [Bryobacteraceae bacterium]|nr:hypothetical protein [Bryobacteraceae bacterium]